MNHGSLFSGIGGFDLAAEWTGWNNSFHCEINEFGKRILQHYWPEAVSYDDITKTDFTIWGGRIDVLTGGFPCQPFSHAGLRKGTADERHLWPEMLRAIREIKPRWVVGENVGGIISWDGGLVFEQVHTDLEAQGYEVQAFVLPACGVNAPHRRDRVWFVAHAVGDGRERERAPASIKEGREPKPGNAGELAGGFERFRPRRPVAHSNDTGLQGRPLNGGIEEIGALGNEQPSRFLRADWQEFPTFAPVCGGDDGLPARLDEITVSKWRRESVKAYGNAIVPQVAYQIFQAINSRG